MDRKAFRLLAEKRPVLLDGAIGTELVRRGMPAGACPEKWALDNPGVIKKLHREYAEAGSDIIFACTFGANRRKLADHGLAASCREMNVALAGIAREAAGGRLVFGDLSPTGAIMEPSGDLGFEEAVDIYRQQAEALVDGGVDGLCVETMLDLQEARAALIAARSVADIPVLVSLTFGADGLTLGGTPPGAALVALQALGADAVGCNCSTGPSEMRALLEAMLPYARVPLLAVPNAGIPVFDEGGARYSLAAGDFARSMREFAAMGVRILGGCCGTTPHHIAATAAMLDGAAFPVPNLRGRPVVGSYRGVVDFSPDEGSEPPLVVVGERINPTGKKKFQAELLAGDLDGVARFAEEQVAAGADMLDVNLGLGGLDEAACLRRAVAMLYPAVPAPLCIDTVDPEAMEQALRIYPGRALVNSVSGEKNRLERLLPTAAKYGAMLIVLPVGDGFIPAKPEERLAVTRDILAEASRFGYGLDDVLVDGLAMTIGADPGAGANALQFLRRCRGEVGARTILGLSNVSFGLPERKWLNAAFLAMAMANGLSAVIANPSAEPIMEIRAAADALAGRRGGVSRYLARFSGTAKNLPPAQAGNIQPSPAELAARAVLKGELSRAAKATRDALSAGVAAGDLLSRFLIPAIVGAGELYEAKEYFLPQLMLAGEAMRRALEVLEPELSRERRGGAGEGKGRVVMATVRGDVHDIGKNLVSLMLGNHGFAVTDLGKDVSAETIVSEAERIDADVIGLSALMTTTLAAMRDTVQLARRRGIRAAIMVGGAAVTEAFAGEMGADGYAPDAVTAVRLAERLVAERRG